MWILLKAEVSYYKTILFCAYGLTVGFLVLSLPLGFESFYPMQGVVSVAFWGSIIMMGSKSDTELRDRFHMQLPVSVAAVNGSRLMFLLLYMASFLPLYTVPFFLDHFGSGDDALWSILCVSAYAVIIVLFFVILHDLSYYSSRAYKWLYLLGCAALLALVIMAVLLGYMDPESLSIGSGIAKDSSDALALYLVLAAMLVCSYVVYERRTSYLA